MGSSEQSNDNDLGLPARFWAKVRKNANDGGCWEWTGSHDDKGYGTFKVGKRVRRPHRMVLEAKLGCTLDPEVFACHTCDNPPCLNPDHLWAGTAQDNMRDCARKGRAGAGPGNAQARGEDAGNVTLTEEDVRAIRASTGTTEQVAACFGIGQSNVSKIRLRRTWKHVP